MLSNGRLMSCWRFAIACAAIWSSEWSADRVPSPKQADFLVDRIGACNQATDRGDLVHECHCKRTAGGTMRGAAHWWASPPAALSSAIGTGGRQAGAAFPLR